MVWDVMGGVARRSCARNENAMSTVKSFNQTHAEGYHITEPYLVEEGLIEKLLTIEGQSFAFAKR